MPNTGKRHLTTWYAAFGRLSPALPGSALLLALAFGCGLASNTISSSYSNSTNTQPEVLMDATTMRQGEKPISGVRQAVVMILSVFLATVADIATGIATSG